MPALTAGALRTLGRRPHPHLAEGVPGSRARVGAEAAAAASLPLQRSEVVGLAQPLPPPMPGASGGALVTPGAANPPLSPLVPQPSIGAVPFLIGDATHLRGG